MNEQKPRKEHLYEWYLAVYKFRAAENLKLCTDEAKNMTDDLFLFNIYSMIGMSFCLLSPCESLRVKFYDSAIKKYENNGVGELLQIVCKGNIKNGSYMEKELNRIAQKSIPIEAIFCMYRNKKLQESITKKSETGSFRLRIYECIICGETGVTSNCNVYNHVRTHGVRVDPYMFSFHSECENVYVKQYISSANSCVFCGLSFITFGKNKKMIDFSIVIDHIVHAHIKIPENELVIGDLMKMLEKCKTTD